MYYKAQNKIQALIYGSVTNGLAGTGPFVNGDF
jgi:hypothetical protein